MNIDIIGDIHGCFLEFQQLTEKLGYQWKEGLPVHPENRQLGFVGDLTDRGPHSLKVIETIYWLVKKEAAIYVPGNHCNKLYRYFLGRNVHIKNGLETTVEELKDLPYNERNKYKKMFMTLYAEAPLYARLDQDHLVMAHAGIRKQDIGKYNKRVETFVLYGDITGEKHPDGSPVPRDWAQNYDGDTFIVYGHTPVKEPRFCGNTVNIDTGAVFGGKLTAFRYPEKEIVQVPSSLPYVREKFKSFD